MTAPSMFDRLWSAGIRTRADAESLTIQERDRILDVAAWGGDEDADWDNALAYFDRALVAFGDEAALAPFMHPGDVTLSLTSKGTVLLDATSVVPSEMPGDRIAAAMRTRVDALDERVARLRAERAAVNDAIKANLAERDALTAAIRAYQRSGTTRTRKPKES